MIAKGCLYHIVRFQDLDFEIPPIVSFPVVSESTEVFPNDLPIIPPKWIFDFGIDLSLDTNSISIPHYRMDLIELKELKAQLKDSTIQVFDYI